MQKGKSKRCEVEIKLLHEGAVVPQKSKKGSIGYDLALAEDFVVPAHSRIVIPLGFAINLPYGVEAKIEPRSGFSSKGMEGYGTKIETKKLFGFLPLKKSKSGLLRFNADVLVGKIDPLYTESVGVIVSNHDERFVLRKGTRIAQMTFYRTTSPWFVKVSELSSINDSRGGGFGSSGSGAAD